MKKLEKPKTKPLQSNIRQRTSNNNRTFQFIDNRPESKLMEKRQGIVDNSQQVRRLNAIRKMADRSNSATTVIQAKLKNPFGKSPEKEHELNLISFNIDKYNSIGGFRLTFPLEERQQALSQLAVVERLIYSWFGSHQMQGTPLDIEMRHLMNAVLDERQSLVHASLKNNDKAPPVANLDKLPGLIQKKVAETWHKLLHGEGIQIKGDNSFQLKILTDFSRLLETQMGQTLIGGIIDTAKGLIIHPTTLAHGKFVARPNDSEKEGLLNSAPDPAFMPVDLRGMEEHNRLQALQHIRTTHLGSPGVSVTSEKGVKHFRFGEGTGSTLPVPADSRDAMMHPSSRMADRSGNEVIAPTFINLGHELGHVLRSAQGMSGAGEAGRDLIQHGFNNAEVSRPEEFFNIGGVENKLRRESGIKERHGHGNYYSHWASSGMTQIFKMIDEINVLKTKVQPGSDKALRLSALEHHFNSLIEPFQELMRGNGNVDQLKEVLRKEIKDVNEIVRELADEDRARRTHDVMMNHGGVINAGSEGNRTIGDFDL